VQGENSLREIRFTFSAKQTAFEKTVEQRSVSFFGGARGGGKALKLTEPIPTPDGWKLNGDLQVGDLVLAENGLPVKIIATTNVCYEHAYKLTFSDGTSIISSDNHLWKTMTHHDRRLAERRNDEYRAKRRATRPSRGKGKNSGAALANASREHECLLPPTGEIRTTKDIVDTLYTDIEVNHSVTQQPPIEFSEKTLIIPPYTLGAWLGDGTSSNHEITGIDKGIFDMVRADGFEVVKMKGLRHKIIGLSPMLKATNVFKNKHIPIGYLRASIDQRLALVRGLMDTDGWCDKDGGCAITLKSEKLFSGVVALLRTLGIIVHTTQVEKVCTNSKTKARGLYHNAKFVTSLPVFGLKRKLERQKKNPQTRYTARRFIVLAESVGIQEMRCITIENPDGMYLAGEQLIPTHNSYILRNLMLKRRLQYPGTHGVIFRRTYEELESNHIRKILSEHPWLKKFYKKQERLIELPNGSTMEFCHCRFLDELDLYQGREWEDIAIDEAGQWPEEWVTRLRASNRTAQAGLKPRMLLTGNPGGIGHQFLKRLFVTRKYNKNEVAGDYGFVQAFVQDNPALMKNDPDYIKRLNAEPNELIRRAWLYGDWDLEAGQFFTELSRKVHLIKPFKIPDHWRRFAAFDPGYHHPAGFGWFACDEDGNVYFYRWYCEKGKRIDQIARDIHKYADTKKLYQTVGGHDCWARGRDGGPTIADQFGSLLPEQRIYLSKANIDRLQGAHEVRKRFAWRDMSNGIEGPRLFFFDTPDVRSAWESLANMTHDPKRPEDVLKVDASEHDKYSGDEAYDVLRYAMMSWPMTSKSILAEHIPTVEENRNLRAKKWHEKKRRLRRKGGQKWDAVLGKHLH